MLSQRPPGGLVLSTEKYPEVSITSIEPECEPDSNTTSRPKQTEFSQRKLHHAPSIDTVISSTMESRAIPRSAPASSTSSPSPALTGAKSPPSAAKPKKWDAVVSYLTFREPSVQAMKQYEKELRRKNGRKSATPSGMTMSSTKNLPSTLPKVNSAWTGIPDQATRQRSKKLVPPKSMSQPALRADPYRDDVESIDSRFTGSSTQGRGGSSLWSSSFRDTHTETSSSSPRASTASLTNSVQIYSSGASFGSLTKTDPTSPSTQRYPGGDSIYAAPIVPKTHHQAGRLSESGSVSTSYSTPMSPPPVPPEYLESAAGQVYPNPVYSPKNSDGSLMQDSHERHGQLTTLSLQQPPSVANAPPPAPIPPRDPLAPHPFRKLRVPRPPETGADAASSTLKQSEDDSTAPWDRSSESSGRKQRPKLSLRPESMFGKKQLSEPPKSAPPDGRRGFLRRESFRD